MAKKDPDYRVGDKVRVLTTSGNYEGTVVVTGDFSRGDMVVVVETADKIRIPVTSRQFLQLIQKGPNQVESTDSGNEEENDSADNLIEGEDNAMATKKISKISEVESTKPSKVVKEKIAKQVKEKIGKKEKVSGVEFNKSMQQLSRESGVSVITLRKYMTKRSDEITHSKAENGTFKFNEQSVKDVAKIKEANLKVYGK